jgi:hypothetical protein
MRTVFLTAQIFVLITLCSCAATAHKRSFGEVVDDNVVALRLQSKYMKDEIVKAKDVHIQVWKGVATLTGRVNSQAQINRAIEIAEQQKGIREVKAYLILRGEGELLENSQTQKPLLPFLKKKTATRVKKVDNKEGLHEKVLDEGSQEQEAREINSVANQSANDKTADYKEFN